MLASLIRLVSVIATVLVVLGFIAFAVDETREGSERQVRAVEGATDPAPDAAGERAREAANGPVREAIDDANDVLLAPFANLTNSNDVWVQRLIPTGLALLLYGLGLGLLAGYIPKGRPQARDWRTE